MSLIDKKKLRRYRLWARWRVGLGKTRGKGVDQEWFGARLTCWSALRTWCMSQSARTSVLCPASGRTSRTVCTGRKAVGWFHPTAPRWLLLPRRFSSFSLIGSGGSHRRSPDDTHAVAGQFWRVDGPWTGVGRWSRTARRRRENATRRFRQWREWRSTTWWSAGTASWRLTTLERLRLASGRQSAVAAAAANCEKLEPRDRDNDERFADSAMITDKATAARSWTWPARAPHGTFVRLYDVGVWDCGSVAHGCGC